MIHTILVMTMLVIFLIVSLAVHLIWLLIRCFDSKKADVFIMRWVQGGFRMVMFLSGVKVTVLGRENIPQDRSVVFMANHRSMYDIVTVYASLPRPTGILAKQELKKVPLLNLMMLDIHCLFLDRSSIEEGLKMIMAATDLVKSGISYMVFPEGTRSKEEGNFLPFHAGSFKIAIKSGAPIVPVTIVNTGDIFESHFPRITPAHVVIEFGKPIETQGVKPSERKLIPDRTRNIIMETYAKDKELI